MLTAEVGDPTGLGRIVRDDDGAVRAIVEEKDATAEQRAIREINAGVYVVDAAALCAVRWPGGRCNAQGEAVHHRRLGMLVGDGARVGGSRPDPGDAWAATTTASSPPGAERSTTGARRAMRSGVTVVDPATTWVDVTVDSRPTPCCCRAPSSSGTTTVASGAVVGPDNSLIDCEVGEGAGVVRSHCLLA